MKEITFFGHGGAYNHGCEAIVRSTMTILKQNEITDSVNLYTNSIASDTEFGLDKLVSLHKQRIPFNTYNPRHVFAMGMRKMFKSDRAYLDTFFKGMVEDVHDSICISIGGDMYCYGKLSWLYYTHERLKKNNNKTVLWGCSVDENSFFPEAMEDLKRYDLIVTRESISYNLFKENGIENVKLYPDPAFCLERQEYSPPFPFDGSNTVAINASPLMSRYTTDSAASADGNLHNLIKHIMSTTKLNIVLVPHVNGAAFAEDDFSYLSEYYEKYKQTKRIQLLDSSLNCCQLKDVIARSRFLITARTHASIAAYSTGVPTLVLGYSVKSRGIATDIFGTDNGYVLPVQSLKGDNELIEAFKWLCKNEGQIKTHLAAFMPEYIRRSAEAGQEITLMKGKVSI